MTAKSIRNFFNLSKERKSYIKPYENKQKESSSDKGGWDGILFHEKKNMKCCFADLGAKI